MHELAQALCHKSIGQLVHISQYHFISVLLYDILYTLHYITQLCFYYLNRTAFFAVCHASYGLSSAFQVQKWADSSTLIDKWQHVLYTGHVIFISSELFFLDRHDLWMCNYYGWGSSALSVKVNILTEITDVVLPEHIASASAVTDLLVLHDGGYLSNERDNDSTMWNTFAFKY